MRTLESIQSLGAGALDADRLPARQVRLGDACRACGISAERRTAVAQAFAGALLPMLRWWIDHGMPGSGEQMDELYHRLVWRGVG